MFSANNVASLGLEGFADGEPRLKERVKAIHLVPWEHQRTASRRGLFHL